ncbi:hypothetical protein ACWF0M_20960 [Kribbella sp. NPDC055110]
MTTLLYKAAGDIRGDDILPLNELRAHYPDLYEREFAKYAVHPEIVDYPVYPLGCRWADVVFLSPVHPAKTCILLKRHDPDHRPQPAEDFIPYTPEAAAALSTPSERALHRLRNLNATEPLYPWADIPHILHRGPIPVRWFKVSAQESQAAE